MYKGRRKERDYSRVCLRPPLEKMGLCRGRDFDEQYKLSISKSKAKQTNKIPQDFLEKGKNEVY